MQELIELIQWGNPVYKSDTFNETFKSALEKEKDQIENAFDMGRDEATRNFIEDGEEYYNKKYKPETI